LSRRSEGRGRRALGTAAARPRAVRGSPGGRALAPPLVVALLAVLALLPCGRLAAQEPTRPDTAARVDTVARPDSARRRPTVPVTDSAARAGVSDSTVRDSVVAEQLAAADTLRRPTVFDLLQLDRLRLVALGATVGGAWPSQTEATQLYSLHADYGEIARGVRVVFTASYWGSRYNGGAVRGYEQAIRDAVIDPAADDTVRLGRMSVSDVAIGVEARWSPFRRRLLGRSLRPFVGAGLAAHAINVEGKALGNSFVEGALDQIAAAVNGAAGLDVAVLPNFQLTMLARYDLFSGVRHATARAGFSYLFDAREGR
jgi:hypothetical protein